MGFFKRISAFVLIFALFTSFSSLFVAANDVSINNISANSACLMEAESGKIIYSKNGSKRMPMASTTKVMTAIIALESGISLKTLIKVPKDAVGVEGSSVYLRQGESVTFEMLLYALMLSSANDAAVAIALTVSRSVEDFVALMNAKAQNLELLDTHFTNPHGLYDEDHYTTAQDLAKLMAYAMKNADFAKVTSSKTKTFARDGGTYFSLSNHNRLLKTYDGVIGGKTGFTKKSGRCLVTCAERDGLRLIAVTLNAPNDWNDHTKLYDFGFASYKRVYFSAQSLKIPVISGTKNEILVSSETFSILLPKEHNEITIRINAPLFLFARIKQGEKVGQILYSLNGKIIATSPLYSREDVATIKYKFNLLEWLRDLFKGILN